MICGQGVWGDVGRAMGMGWCAAGGLAAVSGDWRGFWGGGRVDEGEVGDGDGGLDWVV